MVDCRSRSERKQSTGRELHQGVHIRSSGNRHRWLIAIIGTSIAFVFGYVFVSNYPHSENWHQGYLAPALKYACTGHFGRFRLAENASAEDHAATAAAFEFLEVRALHFSCSSFPHHVMAVSVFDGFDSSNVDQPIYLMLSYGVLWRWFGADWSLSHYVIAALVAVSFLMIYFCTWRFMPGLVAAGAILMFLSSPLFIRNVLSPRDALKIPFIVGIIALLIGYATSPRRPLRFVAFASGLGLLIGFGYGFRSDLLLFVVPAGFIIAFLGRLDLPGTYLSRTRKKLTNAAVRASAVGALFFSFVAAGWLPLLNDYYLHEHNRDVPYHSLAAGLYGITNHDLFQSHLRDGMYMFRSSYNNDLSIGVRVLEYALRRYGDDTVPWAQGRYWTYAKRYYLDVASHIPADLISGAVGAFMNLMTVPASMQSLVLFVDPSHPWAESYSFARNTVFFDVFVRPMERLSEFWRVWPLHVMLVINVVIVFAFLCLIALRFGFGSAVAAIVLLGTILCVISLRFEQRHVCYLYAFPVIAWASVLWLSLRCSASLTSIVYHRLRGIPIEGDRFRAWCRTVAPAASFVAILALGVFAAVYLALSAARTYQADRLSSLISDWLRRQRVPVEFDATDVGDGVSLIRVRSPMPISTGGVRTAGDPVTSRIEMSVVAVEFDGTLCPGRLVSIAGIGVSDPNPDDIAFRIWEDFSIRLENEGNYVAFLPAFFYRLDGISMRFSGLRTPTQNLSCIRSVAAVSEFKKDDVLFDFFIPEQPERLRKEDLFQGVVIPRLGVL